MVAIHNQQTWGRERTHHGHHRARVRLHWMRIGVLAGLIAFWAGAAFAVLRLI